jgi:hypothetical protein
LNEKGGIEFIFFIYLSTPEMLSVVY